MLSALILFVFHILFAPVVFAEKPLIAVLPFEEGDFSWKGFKGEEILNGITQMVTDRLVNNEEVRVIERSRIDEIMDEQDLGQSGRINPATAAEIGKILGVDSLIMGTLTMMDVGESGGISIGSLSAKNMKARVVITGRVVNATTGEIKNSFEAEGEESETSLSISDLKGLSFGSSSFESSVLGKSIQEAVKGFTENIVANPEKLISTVNIIEGKIVKIIADKFIINIGSEDGVKKNQPGQLIRIVPVEELNEDVEVPIGKIQVYSVNDNSSIIIATEIDEQPEEGDLIQIENIE